MGRLYTAIEIAEYVIDKCTKESHPISNLQLQKILYYIQTAFLQKTGAPIFNDDIAAWQFGPVVPNIYYLYCGYGSLPISIIYDNLNIDDEAKSIIDPIVVEKRQLSPWTLVSDTHNPAKAWAQIYNTEGCYSTIPTDLIKQIG